MKSTPKAGKTVPVGSTVDVEVASGQNKVPDVTGKSNTEAASILENAGFTPKEEPRETTDAEPGTVVDQTPAGKSLARLGSTVTIFVATGAGGDADPDTDTTTATPAAVEACGAVRRAGTTGRQTVAATHRVGVAAGHQPVGEQSVTTLGEHRLGVELHALERQVAVAQRHDHAARRTCGDLELVGQRAVAHRQRVIARRRER